MFKDSFSAVSKQIFARKLHSLCSIVQDLEDLWTLNEPSEVPTPQPSHPPTTHSPGSDINKQLCRRSPRKGCSHSLPRGEVLRVTEEEVPRGSLSSPPDQKRPMPRAHPRKIETNSDSICLEPVTMMCWAIICKIGYGISSVSPAVDISREYPMKSMPNVYIMCLSSISNKKI